MLGMTSTLALLVLGSGGETPEWGGFRGNNGSGLAVSGGLPNALNPEENLLWKTELPPGYSSPTIAGDHILLTGATGNELVTMSIDKISGEIQWRQAIEFDGTKPGANSAASPSPVTDGERVYAVFHGFGLVCYDMEGEEQWTLPMDPPNIPHGMSTSPVVHEGFLILQVDQDMDAYLIAVDKKTGEEKWKTVRPGATHSYSTPAVYMPKEGPAQLVVSGSFQISGYSIETGEKLWWVDGAAWQTKSLPLVDGDVCYVNAYMVPSSEFNMPPLAKTWEEELAERDADGSETLSRDEWQDPALNMAWFIFDLDGDEVLDEKDWEYLGSAATATGGFFAIDLTGKGNVTETHVKWTYDDRRGLPDAPSPLLLDGSVYLMKDGILTALDAKSGEVVKQDRVGESDQYFASPVAAGGKIVTAGISGQLAVISAGAEWEVLSVNTLDEAVWSTPAVADDLIFVRSQQALYCFFNDAEE